MKNLKKIMVLLIAMVMVVGMSVSVFAADTHTITVKSTDTHTYKVFQVLTGTLSEEGSYQLGNPEWGADAISEPGDVNTFITSITADGLTEAQIADLVAAKANTTGNGRGTVDKDNPMSGLATGYYVLVDVTDLSATTADKNDALALHVVEVLNDVEVTVKHETTSSDKEIVAATEVTKTGENAKAITYDLDNDTKHEAGDADIGGTVNYKLSGTVPANASYYDYYFFVFNDTLGKGLTLKTAGTSAAKTDFTVKADGTAIDAFNFEVTKNDTTGETEIHIYLTNAKAQAGKTITVEYAATVNEDANIGETANENKSNVTFSNNPNKDYNGEQDQNTPGKPKETTEDIYGETPEQKTYTYTTGVELQKVDENGEALKGAEFTITGPSTHVVLVSSETFTEAAGGTYYKLKDGTYTTTAPTVDRYVEDGTGTATTTEGYLKNDSDGSYYIPTDKSEYDGKQLYKLVKGTSDKYETNSSSGEYVRYNKSVSYTTKVGENQTETNIKAEVGPDGLVRFVGLNEGTYTIKETKTPAGYNTLPDFDITIAFNATPENDGVHWSATSDFVKADDNDNGDVTYQDGVFKITVVNQKGQELPSTGGIGTTIFYILGGALVLGAAVILITRRRINA